MYFTTFKIHDFLIRIVNYSVKYLNKKVNLTLKFKIHDFLIRIVNY